MHSSSRHCMGITGLHFHGLCHTAPDWVTQNCAAPHCSAQSYTAPASPAGHCPALHTAQRRLSHRPHTAALKHCTGGSAADGGVCPSAPALCRIAALQNHTTLRDRNDLHSSSSPTPCCQLGHPTVNVSRDGNLSGEPVTVPHHPHSEKRRFQSKSIRLSVLVLQGQDCPYLSYKLLQSTGRSQ